AAHSNFRRAPLQRLWRTLDLMLTITFADAVCAVGAVRAIERVHSRVHGRLDAGVGPFPRGTRYDACDPHLLLWVHATLVDAALLVYERFVEALPARTRRTYYEESKIVARLFRIPEHLIPARLSDFQAYVNGMIDGDTLAAGPASQEIAASILCPPLPVGLRQAFQAANFFTIGLLPPVIRQRYGLSWDALREAAMQAMARTSQHVLPLLPGTLRTLSQARYAPTQRSEPGARHQAAEPAP
ncbi:MAG: oxygenase MpaB family protein, partial [Candidatus Binatia bacterium]